MYMRIIFEISVFYLMIFYALNNEKDYNNQKGTIIEMLFRTSLIFTSFIFLIMIQQNLLTKAFFYANAIIISVAWLIIFASKQE